MPTVEILDEAVPPLKKSSPKVLYSSLSGAIFIFLLISLGYIYKQNKNKFINKK